LREKAGRRGADEDEGRELLLGLLERGGAAFDVVKEDGDEWSLRASEGYKVEGGERKN